MYADRILETSTTTGTGDFTLAGAVSGYRTFNTGVGVGPAFAYCILAIDGSGVPTGEWEAGEGWLSGTTTLVRNNPQTGSAAVPISFSAGTKRVNLSPVSTQLNAIGSGTGINNQTNLGGF